ncbi:hypothetical protein IV203_037037 [Nitzschia inconspicua]|uniref:Uncharacterized protein n=1 Tax=Nitzschia inconspicua TaxID=303405 RepID=A0A9K3PY77_9STRA|nr:hypothetical protein IV203_037037 [Nitzschia inconspicua]
MTSSPSNSPELIAVGGPFVDRETSTSGHSNKGQRLHNTGATVLRRPSEKNNGRIGNNSSSNNNNNKNTHARRKSSISKNHKPQNNQAALIEGENEYEVEIVDRRQDDDCRHDTSNDCSCDRDLDPDYDAREDNVRDEETNDNKSPSFPVSFRPIDFSKEKHGNAINNTKHRSLFQKMLKAGWNDNNTRQTNKKVALKVKLREDVVDRRRPPMSKKWKDRDDHLAGTATTTTTTTGGNNPTTRKIKMQNNIKLKVISPYQNKLTPKEDKQHTLPSGPVREECNAKCSVPPAPDDKERYREDHEGSLCDSTMQNSEFSLTTVSSSDSEYSHNSHYSGMEYGIGDDESIFSEGTSYITGYYSFNEDDSILAVSTADLTNVLPHKLPCSLGRFGRCVSDTGSILVDLAPTTAGYYDWAFSIPHEQETDPHHALSMSLSAASSSEDSFFPDTLQDDSLDRQCGEPKKELPTEIHSIAAAVAAGPSQKTQQLAVLDFPPIKIAPTAKKTPPTRLTSNCRHRAGDTTSNQQQKVPLNPVASSKSESSSKQEKALTAVHGDITTVDRQWTQINEDDWTAATTQLRPLQDYILRQASGQGFEVVATKSRESPSMEQKQRQQQEEEEEKQEEEHLHLIGIPSIGRDSNCAISREMKKEEGQSIPPLSPPDLSLYEQGFEVLAQHNAEKSTNTIQWFNPQNQHDDVILPTLTLPRMSSKYSPAQSQSTEIMNSLTSPILSSTPRPHKSGDEVYQSSSDLSSSRSSVMIELGDSVEAEMPFTMPYPKSTATALLHDLHIVKSSSTLSEYCALSRRMVGQSTDYPSGNTGIVPTVSHDRSILSKFGVEATFDDFVAKVDGNDATSTTRRRLPEVTKSLGDNVDDMARIPVPLPSSQMNVDVLVEAPSDLSSSRSSVMIELGDSVDAQMPFTMPYPNDAATASLHDLDSVESSSTLSEHCAPSGRMVGQSTDYPSGNREIVPTVSHDQSILTKFGVEATFDDFVARLDKTQALQEKDGTRGIVPAACHDQSILTKFGVEATFDDFVARIDKKQALQKKDGDDSIHNPRDIIVSTFPPPLEEDSVANDLLTSKSGGSILSSPCSPPNFTYPMKNVAFTLPVNTCHQTEMSLPLPTAEMTKCFSTVACFSHDSISFDDERESHSKKATNDPSLETSVNMPQEVGPVRQKLLMKQFIDDTMSPCTICFTTIIETLDFGFFKPPSSISRQLEEENVVDPGPQIEMVLNEGCPHPSFLIRHGRTKTQQINNNYNANSMEDTNTNNERVEKKKKSCNNKMFWTNNQVVPGETRTKRFRSSFPRKKRFGADGTILRDRPMLEHQHQHQQQHHIQRQKKPKTKRTSAGAYVRRIVRMAPILEEPHDEENSYDAGKEGFLVEWLPLAPPNDSMIPMAGSLVGSM